MLDLPVPYESELYKKERHFCAVDYFKFRSNHISVQFLLLQQMLKQMILLLIVQCTQLQIEDLNVQCTMCVKPCCDIIGPKGQLS